MRIGFIQSITPYIEQAATHTELLREHRNVVAGIHPVNRLLPEFVTVSLPLFSPQLRLLSRKVCYNELSHSRGSLHRGQNVSFRSFRTRANALKSKKVPLWACSSAGRAPALQAGGQGFESPHVHQLIPAHQLTQLLPLLLPACSVSSVQLRHFPTREERIRSQLAPLHQVATATPHKGASRVPT